MNPGVTRAEIAALLAVGQDHAFAQPAGSQLRATVLGQRLAEAAGASAAELETCWWTGTLRFLGCTSHAFDMAQLFGDEIEVRAEAMLADNASPPEMVRLMLAHAGPGRHGLDRVRALLGVLATGRAAMEMNFRTACEVSDVLATRLGVDSSVRASLATSFERWNGRGFPTGCKGTAIPLPMRVTQLSQEFEALARAADVHAAVATIRARRGKTYDPTLADLVVAHGPNWYDEVVAADPWDAALDVAPPGHALTEAEAHDALLVLADFTDLKSPWTGGHSRAVAGLAREASGPLAEAAALVHDFGVVAIPNSILDKPSPLTRDERERMETHAMVTDQLLRRLAFTARLAVPAGGAHERLDQSGYHRRPTAGELDEAARVVAAADSYQAMVSDRPHRAALTAAEAAAELRRDASAGRLDGEAVERVLASAGHRRVARPAQPGGLTSREVDVVRLMALGLTTREIAAQLVVSPKTADHHVQHIYRKIGASTRGAAALFAIENGLVPAGRDS
ncbi:MAG TPA: HD domain-containing phosphohydrolase [Mycobacteriales bacterium]|nr:HD domain-containing phosphohydrolase [Mycobacteriales bacterium]